MNEATVSVAWGWRSASIEQGISCYVNHPTPFAPSFAAGAGLLWQATGLRLDFQYQVQTFTLYEQEANTDSGTVSAKVRLQQSRAWWFVGREF
jgi:hypothetical protein